MTTRTRTRTRARARHQNGTLSRFVVPHILLQVTAVIIIIIIYFNVVVTSVVFVVALTHAHVLHLGYVSESSPIFERKGDENRGHH